MSCMTSASLQRLVPQRLLTAEYWTMLNHYKGLRRPTASFSNLTRRYIYLNTLSVHIRRRGGRGAFLLTARARVESSAFYGSLHRGLVVGNVKAKLTDCEAPTRSSPQHTKAQALA